jgi:phosphoglycolate phosphatase
VRIYSGVPEVLRAIKAAGIPQATASSKPENQVLAILEHYELIDDFTIVAGALPDAAGLHDGKEPVLRRAVQRLADAGVDVSRPVLIGDRLHDIEGAKPLGIPVIFVTWGFGEPGESAGSVAEVATPEELLRLLLPRD